MQLSLKLPLVHINFLKITSLTLRRQPSEVVYTPPGSILANFLGRIPASLVFFEYIISQQPMSVFL